MRLFLRYVLCALLLAGCAGSGSPMFKAGVQAGSPAEDKGVVLVGAGDIARCSFNAAHMTATLLDTIEGTVFTAGDNVYQHGTAEEFRKCYEPTWGRHKHRTYPSPGNHDYSTLAAAPYYEYFGERAGPAGLGYFSYDIGAWHILSLNSNVSADEASPQMKWLREDLAKSTHLCTLAYWHHPVFASSKRANNPRMKEIFAELYKQGVDVVVAGHEHVYERFAPVDARGERDPKKGIRSFIVGTGGALLGPFGTPHPASEVRFSKHGVIKFTLKKTGYDWEFIPVFDGEVTDSGSDVCH